MTIELYELPESLGKGYAARYLDGFMDCSLLCELCPQSQSYAIALLRSNGFTIADQGDMVDLKSRPWYTDRVIRACTL
jgi:hypothetical protein